MVPQGACNQGCEKPELKRKKKIRGKITYFMPNTSRTDIFWVSAHPQRSLSFLNEREISFKIQRSPTIRGQLP